MIIKLEQRIETRKDVSALTVRLTGDYKDVDYSGAWEKMINYCEKENRVGCIDAEYISVYLGDPMTTPAEKGGRFDRLSDRRGEFKVRCPAGITAGQRRRCRA